MAERVIAVIQARMGSSRLPGKVLRPLGPTRRPVLSWVVRAAKHCRTVDKVVVATSTEAADDAVVRSCAALGVPAFRGSEHDVLDRFVGAANAFGADWVLRITADCPLADPAVMDRVVSEALERPGVDYATSALERTLPLGLDAEVVNADALRRADALATGHHRSHVTSLVYSEPGPFTVHGVRFEADAADLRATLDTPEDLDLLQGVTALLGDAVHPWQSVVEVLRSHPELAAVNAHVRQKALSLG